MIAQTRYHNDGKEKFQSHEMHVDAHNIFTSYYNGRLTLEAYGADKAEAAANLRAALRHMINDAQETLAFLPTPELPDPPAVSSEIDAVFDERLGTSISYGKRRFTEAQDVELQRKTFGAAFKQQIIDNATKPERRHHMPVPLAMCDVAEAILKHCAEIHQGFTYETVDAGTPADIVDFLVSFPTP